MQPIVSVQTYDEKSSISNGVGLEASQSASTLLNDPGSHAGFYFDSPNLCKLLPNHAILNAAADMPMNTPMLQSLMAHLLPQAQNVPISTPSVEDNSSLTQTLLELLLSRPEVQGLLNSNAPGGHFNFLKTIG